MSVDELEIMCWVYINSVQDIEKYVGQGLYNLDKYREKWHNEICRLSGLDKKITYKYTNNLDKIDYNGTELYLLLLNEMKKGKEEMNNE